MGAAAGEGFEPFTAENEEVAKNATEVRGSSDLECAENASCHR